MNLTQRFVFLILAFAVVASVGSAQKRSGDRRPLSGLNATAIPKYASLQEYLRARQSPNLLSFARPVGSAQKVPFANSTQVFMLGKTQPLIPQLKIERSANGTVRWLEGQLSSPESAVSLRKQAATTAQKALAILKAQSGLPRLNNPVEELTLMSSTRDELSYEHVRFQQVYRGVPVWGRDLYVHFDPQGAAYLMNGTYEPTPVNVEVVPARTPMEALQVVVEDLKAQNKYQPLSREASAILGMNEPTAALVLYPTPEGTIRLAYEVSIHPNLLEWYSYIVDAHMCQILSKIARHCKLWPDDKASVSTTSGALTVELPRASSGAAGSFASATATDLNGVSQTMRVWNDGAGAYYLVWDLPNLDAGKSQLPDNPAGGSLTISANYKDITQDTKLLHMVSSNNAWTDPAAVSAHYNMKLSYDYYKNVYARKAIDDKDQSIISIIHATENGKGMENAYWNGRLMVYGDGDTKFKPLAGGLDVAGHEMTHGVIQSTADLIYQNQSGALNESFADVFGVMIDRANYLIGESILKASTGKKALRDLSNPGSSELLSPQPASMAEFQKMGTDQDNGGVHVNSGIPNKAAFNVINAIGKAKAELIYYRALSKYLTRNSQFGDCRKAVEQAAKDLVGQSGITNADVALIGPAFEAVGISVTTGGGSGTNEVPPVVGGKSYIAFMIASGQLGLFDPSSGQAVGFSSPSAYARSSSSDRAQLSTGLSGKNIWFVNQTGQLALVEIASGQVSTFPQVKIQQSGDLWNASISPDESYVTLVSAYSGDATLYIFDGQQLGSIPLTPESTQDGIKVNTIQYPDVVSWSPNMSKPKIGFDAYNEMNVGTSGKVGYWSMYEIDFTAQKIYNLVSSQPSTVSIGNISYSNTNPDLITFNYVDANGKFDTYVGNFDSGQLKKLEIPSFSLNGAPIVDAERPTFSPDDSKLCLSSPANNAFLFFEGSSGQLTYKQFGQAVYNPRWFVQGGKLPNSTEWEKVPAAFRLFDNYPNPFNPSTRIEYELPSRADVRLAVYDILGQTVRTLVNSEHASGRFSAMWDGTNDNGIPLATGIYIYRLQAAEGSGRSTLLSKKMLYLK